MVLTKMSWLKIFLCFLFFLLLLIFCVVESIIFPAIEQHSLLNKNMMIANELSHASTRIAMMMKSNLKYSEILKQKLRDNASVVFLQENIVQSHLSIVSMKIIHNDSSKQIHAVLQGEYDHFLKLLALLSRQPNAMRITSFSLENKSFILDIETVSSKKHLNKLVKSEKSFSRRLKDNLNHSDPPVFFLKNTTLLQGVQSPFSMRTVFSSPLNSMQKLLQNDWYYLGEVRREGRRLGVFLKSQAQSEYFGEGLFWKESHWQIVKIGEQSLVFKNKDNQNIVQLKYMRRQGSLIKI